MILGLLITAMISGGVLSLMLFVMGLPLWIVLLAYPTSGTIVMLFGIAAISWWNQAGTNTAEAPAHFPVQRKTTPTVANSSLTSVMNDKLRS